MTRVPPPEYSDALIYIANYIKENGWPPSRRELAEKFGIGLASAQKLTVEMQAADMLEIGPGARMLRLTEYGDRLSKMKQTVSRYEQF